ncbi:hypothetical protein QCN27_12745 [Cereibacter sp. SYSU M97828]|nr:hypothetical protein [Cereibacter flavus]
MLAENTQVKLVETEAELIELDSFEVDEVSGAVIPVAVVAAIKIGAAVTGTAAAGAGIGFGIGYWANRD